MRSAGVTSPPSWSVRSSRRRRSATPTLERRSIVSSFTVRRTRVSMAPPCVGGHPGGVRYGLLLRRFAFDPVPPVPVSVHHRPLLHHSFWTTSARRLEGQALASLAHGLAFFP